MWQDLFNFWILMPSKIGTVDFFQIFTSKKFKNCVYYSRKSIIKKRGVSGALDNLPRFSSFR
jgi:hypothetical protein